MLTGLKGGVSMSQMAGAGRKQEERRARIWRTAVWLAVYLCVFTAFAFVASQRCGERGLMATLTFVECALLAVVVAIFAVTLDPRELGVWRFVLHLAAVCVLTLLISAGVLGLASAAWGAHPFIGGLAAQLVILSFCILLGSVFAVVRCSGSELLFAQLVCIFVACALMGTVFYADPIIEAQRSSEAKGFVIRAVLATNPITAISWSLLQFDLMHRPLMYGSISVIGDHYTPYPDWWTTLCGYLAISAVTLIGAELLRRHRSLKLIRKGGRSR